MSGEKRDISHPLNIANMTDAQLDKELERGYADMKSGNTIPAQKAFADLRAELKPITRSLVEHLPWLVG